jgi:hypothetical protein
MSKNLYGWYFTYNDISGYWFAFKSADHNLYQNNLEQGIKEKKIFKSKDYKTLIEGINLK